MFVACKIHNPSGLISIISYLDHVKIVVRQNQMYHVKTVVRQNQMYHLMITVILCNFGNYEIRQRIVSFCFTLNNVRLEQTLRLKLLHEYV